MRQKTFAQAIEDAVAFAMAKDPRIIIIGEDVQMIRVNLTARFGTDRVLAAPISEAAFVSAAVHAAMAGMRPIVEVMIVDFVSVAMDSLLNHAAKVRAFSGGRWHVPMVIRMACGGGYGDGGQHMQSLWGWLAHIPGISVVVPSNPEDAAGLMLSAIENEDPVIYLEHKLLADYWLEFMGKGGRNTVDYDVPAAGARGKVPAPPVSIPLGKARLCRKGADLTLVSLGVGVHRALEAAEELTRDMIGCEVIDLRTVQPPDQDMICASVSKTGRLLVIDEDYLRFGLTGEIAAVCLEHGLQFQYKRIATETTIPYSHELELQILPNTNRICHAAWEMLGISPKV